MVYTFIPAPGKSTGGAMEVPFDMKLATCRLCRRIFTSSGSTTCPECMEHLGSCFRLICGYLNNNLKVEVDARALSETLDIDIRYVQALIDLKYFEPIVLSGTKDEVAKKVELARRIQVSLEKSIGMRDAARSGKTETLGGDAGEGDGKDSKNMMYAQDKHGNKRRWK